jgi:hypothetical protein
METYGRDTWLALLLILLCSTIFSAMTVYTQVMHLGSKYIEEGTQLERHRAVIEGTAITPWQYRILSEYVVAGLISGLTEMSVPRPVFTGFISFRLVQNITIFILAAWYYRKLGLSMYVTLLGLTLLAWGMTHSLYHSDLSLNTYSDLILYLLAGLIILYGHYWWIIPVTALGALNRETSGLIPFMLLAYHAYPWPRRGVSKTPILIAVLALAVFTVIFLGVRYLYGPRPLIYPIGIGMSIRVNFLNPHAWAQLALTFGILPFMALFFHSRWPRILKAFFWALFPAWVPIILYTSHMAETRLFLVPHALVIIPGVLFGLASARGSAPSSENTMGSPASN